ncbi:hypothetical protein RLIN73S_03896 [Rhodanobacter lindaniclasticus]
MQKTSYFSLDVRLAQPRMTPSQHWHSDRPCAQLASRKASRRMSSLLGQALHARIWEKLNVENMYLRFRSY